jgi:hypothetical protein
MGTYLVTCSVEKLEISGSTMGGGGGHRGGASF